MGFLAMAARAAVVLVTVTGNPVLAGHEGCRGRDIECYEKVELPGVYATHARTVVIRPDFRQVVQTPPVVINQTEKVLVKPGLWHEQRVLVQPSVRRICNDQASLKRGSEQHIEMKDD